MQVLITGANRGIGAALDNAFAARGVSVLGTARNDPKYLPLEVTDPASHSALAHRLDGQTIDTLVCNAGVYPDKGQTLDNGYPAEMWAHGFAVNVSGVFLTVQALLPNLLLSDKPRIAIISSQMASHARAPGGSYIYRASKAAVLNLGRNLATDLKPRGIAVGIYHPGWVRTDMGSSSADISVEEAAQGLKARFDELSLDKTGCFETWDGRAHPF
ncbi:3-ketoacyl-ACP reductase [Antarctobacter heliothermus]|uniref:3-ketoacyl-ACP reductase n=1 Tax=Antarctobacter heliothermus TaxID=74033 RepID=A0A222EAK3_9RHOB|nr:SDR family NAD(P)-dependent oxidoreductase [Antarctobacter heliothermus]ASP22991.1 3-ketoacyl-ACP reductase [Antarctobacter heliothermus]